MSPEPVTRGVRLGVDVGSVRVGVARTDVDAVLAVPEATVPRADALPRLEEIVAAYEPVCVYVGLPLALDGTEGPAAQAVRSFATELAHAIAPYPVRLVDERMSTVSAQRALHETGRTVKSSRAIIDQVAATMIVEQAVNAERANGTWAGTRVTVGEEQPSGKGPGPTARDEEEAEA